LDQSLEKVSLLNAVLDSGFFLLRDIWLACFLLNLSGVFASCDSLLLLGLLDFSQLDLSDRLVLSQLLVTVLHLVLHVGHLTLLLLS